MRPRSRSGAGTFSAGTVDQVDDGDPGGDGAVSAAALATCVAAATITPVVTATPDQRTSRRRAPRGATRNDTSVSRRLQRDLWPRGPRRLTAIKPHARARRAA